MLKKIDYDSAFAQSKQYFNGGEIEATVFLDKYALKDSEGNLYEATPDDMHHRIAREIHRIEQKYKNPLSYDTIYNTLKGFKYLIPQGSPMAGIGNPFQIMSLSNCFVINHEHDSYGSIMRTDEELVHLMKRRAGVGTDMSHLRPHNTPVKNAARTSSGAVSYMERHSNSTREVAQAGRRGALMLTLSLLHPDAEMFADIKMDETKVTGANISLKVPDEFMEAVERGDTEFTLRFPIDIPVEEATFTKVINPQELWNKIVKNAWSRAEPGLLFWDTIINESLPDCYADRGFKTVSTNPCGEITLCDGDSCRLLAINLYSYVDNPFTSKAKFNFRKFKNHVRIGQRMMDDIVDLEIECINEIIEKIKSDPEPDYIKDNELRLWERIRQKAIFGRRTGFGIVGLGDMLAALGLRYGTEEATDFVETVMRDKKHCEYEASNELAIERGTFPLWNPFSERSNPFLLRIKEENLDLYDKLMLKGRRNIAISTIAPTGTVALMTQTTSGIENLFLPFYYRAKKVNPNDANVRVDFVDKLGDSWQEYPVFHPKFRTFLEVKGLTQDEIDKLSKEEAAEWVKKSPYYKATSNDVDWVNKVRMQGIVQKHVDHSISVTTNLPQDIPVDIVNKVYFEAWKSGCKGVTIYRDGSRSGVLNTKSKKDSEDNITLNNAPKRPKTLLCDVFHTTAKGKDWTVFVGLLNGSPYEVFAIPDKISKHRGVGEVSKIKSGIYSYEGEDGTVLDNISATNSDEEVALARLISTSLRHGAKIDFIVDQLNKSDGSIVSFTKAIARQLKKYSEQQLNDDVNPFDCDREPECAVVYEEGCVKCLTCGNSKCN